jgi:hypothetical protein
VATYEAEYATSLLPAAAIVKGHAGQNEKKENFQARSGNIPSWIERSARDSVVNPAKRCAMIAAVRSDVNFQRAAPDRTRENFRAFPGNTALNFRLSFQWHCHEDPPNLAGAVGFTASVK